MPKAQNKACSITRLSVKVPVRGSNLTEFWQAAFFRSSSPQSYAWSLNPCPRQQTCVSKSLMSSETFSVIQWPQTLFKQAPLSLKVDWGWAVSVCSETSTNCTLCWDRVPLPIHPGHSASGRKAPDFNPVSWCQREKITSSSRMSLQIETRTSNLSDINSVNKPAIIPASTELLIRTEV